MPNFYPDRGVVTAASLAALYTDGEVFPALPGQDFVLSKAPNFSTGIKTAVNGSEVRAQYWPGPIYSFKVQFNVLRDGDTAASLALGSELQQIMAFFNGRAGRYGFFYYYDPIDNVATAETIAHGDGSTTTFQLTRTVGKATAYGAVEPVYACYNAPTSMTVGGLAKIYNTDYTIAPWGAVTFATAPAANAPIVWSGQFLFVCRFDQDKMEFQQLVSDLWSQDGLAFIGITPG